MAFEALGARLRRVRDDIAAHQARAGLTHPVTIVAVTKTFGVEAVLAAIREGNPVVGENRVQEALRKQDEAGPVPAEWHLIGSLQRNKVRQVVGRFALVHSVDRPELAEEIQRRSEGRIQRVLVQVNCSGEPQKGGVEPSGLRPLLDAIAGMPAVDVRGLMTMAALDADEAAQRRTFARLRELRDQVRSDERPLPELSMGMSGDYGAAVEEGATMVRLGTILFGDRT